MITEVKKDSINRNKRRSLICTYIILIIVALIMIVPMFMIINVSFLTEEEFYENPLQISIFGKSIAVLFENYISAWTQLEVVKRFFITIVMALASSVFGVVVSLLMAFPISRGHFKGANKVYTFLLMSMFFPSSLVGVIIVFQFLKIYDTALGLILLWGTGGIAMHTFMLVGFIKSIPKDLDEAAFIDGCHYFKYLFVVAFPLLIPILSTLLMLRMIGAWNDFLNPYIFLTTDKWRTLSTGLYYYKGSFQSEWYSICAATILVALPMILIYVIFQRFIIEGMTAGALKG